MVPAISLAPLTLAAVLVLSGVAKLPDPTATESMMRLLRLPSFLPPRVVSRVLPYVELGTAALLLTPWRWTYAVGAASAAVLFLSFLVIVVRAMGFHPRPTCGCFGRVGDHRINGRTVARNTLLAALAGVAVGIALAGTSTGRLVAGYSANDWLWLLLALALAAVAVFVLGGSSGPEGRAAVGAAGRRGAATTQTSHARDLPAGRQDMTAVPPEMTVAAESPASQPSADAELDYLRVPIPDGVLVDSGLATHRVLVLARHQAQLLLLANCWCGPTYAILERLGGWRELLPELGVHLVHTQAPWDDLRAGELSGVWWDPGAQLWSALEVGGSPAAVLLGADGLLAGGPVTGVDEIEAFIAEVRQQLDDAGATASAPDEHSPGLTGR